MNDTILKNVLVYSCTMLGHVGVNTITYNVEDNSTLHKLRIPNISIYLIA